MSVHDSWIAVQGVTIDVVLEELGLVESGTVGHPLGVARPYCWGSKPGGWTIICANFNGLAHIENVRGLSRHGMVLACDFQDQVDGCTSMAIAVPNGEKLWEIGAANDEIFVTGTPPPELASIRDHYAEKLAQNPEYVWMYEVPIDLAKELCGFRHDEDESPFRGLLPRSDSRWHRNLKLAVHPKVQPSKRPPADGSLKSQWPLIAFIVIVVLWALSPLLP